MKFVPNGHLLGINCPAQKMDRTWWNTWDCVNLSFAQPRLESLGKSTRSNVVDQVKTCCDENGKRVFRLRFDPFSFGELGASIYCWNDAPELDWQLMGYPSKPSFQWRCSGVVLIYPDPFDNYNFCRWYTSLSHDVYPVGCLWRSYSRLKVIEIGGYDRNTYMKIKRNRHVFSNVGVYIVEI